MSVFSQYVGIPFTNLGRSKYGADCWGLARIVQKEQYGIILPELKTYSNALNRTMIENVIDVNKPMVVGEKLKTYEDGCIVIMKNAGVCSHVGVYIGNKQILHTTQSTGAVIEKLSSARLKNKIEGFYRVDKSYHTK